MQRMYAEDRMQRMRMVCRGMVCRGSSYAEGQRGNGNEENYTAVTQSVVVKEGISSTAGNISWHFQRQQEVEQHTLEGQ